MIEKKEDFESDNKLENVVDDFEYDSDEEDYDVNINVWHNGIGTLKENGGDNRRFLNDIHSESPNFIEFYDSYDSLSYGLFPQEDNALTQMDVLSVEYGIQDNVSNIVNCTNLHCSEIMVQSTENSEESFESPQ